MREAILAHQHLQRCRCRAVGRSDVLAKNSGREIRLPHQLAGIDETPRTRLAKDVLVGLLLLLRQQSLLRLSPQLQSRLQSLRQNLNPKLKNRPPLRWLCSP